MKISIESGRICIRDEKGWLLWSAKIEDVTEAGITLKFRRLEDPT